MCALKFYTILEKNKYKMAAICIYVILCILPLTILFFYLTLHQNNGHQTKLELHLKKKRYYVKNNKVF